MGGDKEEDCLVEKPGVAPRLCEGGVRAVGWGERCESQLLPRQRNFGSTKEKPHLVIKQVRHHPSSLSQLGFCHYYIPTVDTGHLRQASTNLHTQGSG